MTGIIVEDDPSLSELLARFLSEFCDEVLTSLTLQDALEKMQRIPPPDLVTLDLAFPDSSVESTISQIHKIRRFNDQSVILVISGMVDPIDEERVIQAGADKVLLKQSLIPMASSTRGFLGNLYDAVRAIIKQPVRYQNNLLILELIAERLAKVSRLKTQRLQ